MLHALLHNKLKYSFEDRFKPSEDSLTSTVFGLMQYLPTEMLWSILLSNCRVNSLIDHPGEFESISFWERMAANYNRNSTVVEPDVLIRFQNIDLIVESKKSDECGQCRGQWEDEIYAFLGKYQEEDKDLYLISIGGNDTLGMETICINEKEIKICKISWVLLLNSIVTFKNSIIPTSEIDRITIRILTDIIAGFEKHEYFKILWLDTLRIDDSISINNNGAVFKTKFEKNKSLLGELAMDGMSINLNSINNIIKWKI